MYPRLWELSGLALGPLCDRLLQLAVDRRRRHARTDDNLRAFVAGALAGTV